MCITPPLQSSGATDSSRQPGMFLPERIGRSAAPAGGGMAHGMDGGGGGSEDHRVEEVEAIC